MLQLTEAVRLGEHIEMAELNIGGTTPGEGKKQLATVVYVTPEEEELIKGLQEKAFVWSCRCCLM